MPGSKLHPHPCVLLSLLTEVPLRWSVATNIIAWSRDHFWDCPVIIFSEVAVWADALCAPTCCPFFPIFLWDSSGPYDGENLNHQTCPTWFQNLYFKIIFVTYVSIPVLLPTLAPFRACLLPFSSEKISWDSGNTAAECKWAFQKLHRESSDLGYGYVEVVSQFFCKTERKI